MGFIFWVGFYVVYDVHWVSLSVIIIVDDILLVATADFSCQRRMGLTEDVR